MAVAAGAAERGQPRRGSRRCRRGGRRASRRARGDDEVDARAAEPGADRTRFRAARGSAPRLPAPVPRGNQPLTRGDMAGDQRGLVADRGKRRCRRREAGSVIACIAAADLLILRLAGLDRLRARRGAAAPMRPPATASTAAIPSMKFRIHRPPRRDHKAAARRVQRQNQRKTPRPGGWPGRFLATDPATMPDSESRLAAAAPAALDLAADQGAGDGAQDRAGGPLAARVDRRGRSARRRRRR